MQAIHGHTNSFALRDNGVEISQNRNATVTYRHGVKREESSSGPKGYNYCSVLIKACLLTL